MQLQLSVGIYNQRKLRRENTGTVIKSFNYHGFLGTTLELSVTTHNMHLLYLHKGTTLNRQYFPQQHIYHYGIFCYFTVVFLSK